MRRISHLLIATSAVTFTAAVGCKPTVAPTAVTVAPVVTPKPGPPKPPRPEPPAEVEGVGPAVPLPVPADPSKPVFPAALGQYGRAGGVLLTVVGWDRKPYPEEKDYCWLEVDAVVLNVDTRPAEFHSSQFVLNDAAGNVQRPNDLVWPSAHRIPPLQPGECGRWTVRYRVPIAAKGLRVLASDQHLGGTPGKNDSIPFIKLIDPDEAAKAGKKAGGDLGESAAAGGAAVADVGIVIADGVIGVLNAAMWLQDTFGKRVPPTVHVFQLGDTPVAKPMPARPTDAPPPPAVAKSTAELAVGKLRLRVTDVELVPADDKGGPRRLVVTVAVRNPTTEQQTFTLGEVVVTDETKRQVPASQQQRAAYPNFDADPNWPFYKPGQTRTLSLEFPVWDQGKAFTLRIDGEFGKWVERIRLNP